MTEDLLTLPQLRADLESKIDHLDVKIDGVKADLETKIDTVKTQILETIRETAEMIDARQARRLSAGLEAQRHGLQNQL